MFAHIAVMLMSLEFMLGTAGANGVAVIDGRGVDEIEAESGMLGIDADTPRGCRIPVTLSVAVAGVPSLSILQWPCLYGCSVLVAM